MPQGLLTPAHRANGAQQPLHRMSVSHIYR